MIEKSKLQLSKITTRGPLAEQVYKEIKNAIISGKLESGIWLHEESLTAALDVSRTPVREALNRLKSEGLVDISPRKGAHVIEFSDSELAELFEVREKVETIFFVRAVKAIPPETIRKFHELLRSSEQAMRKCKDDEQEWDEKRSQYLLHDRALHDALIQASGNKFWQQLYYDIRDRIDFLGNQISFDRKWFDFAIEDHYRILEAVERGDYTSGKLAMKKHVRNVHKGIVRIRKAREKRIDLAQ